MAQRNVWQAVAVAVGTLGTAQAVSAITKANPAVVTYVGIDPANGDYFALTDVQGMIQVNNKVGRVANVNGAGNTLEMETENSTSYDTFTSGNMQPITWATTMSTGAGVSASGGDPKFIDFTTIHDTQEQQIPGVASASVFTFECYWDPTDPSLLALQAASDTSALRAIRITFKTGAKYVFLGYISCNMAPTGSAQEAVKTSLVITAFGRPKAFST